MKIYAACYTDCYHEYNPSVFSLHNTHEGATKAIIKSKNRSQFENEEMQNYCRQNRMVFGPEKDWSSENGCGFERWEIREMEIGE